MLSWGIKNTCNRLPGSHSPQWSKEKKKAHVRGVMPEMRKVARNGRPPAKEKKKKKKTPVRSVMPETKYCHVSSTNIAAKNWAANHHRRRLRLRYPPLIAHNMVLEKTTLVNPLDGSIAAS
ncbi:hypothetical protein BHE74_00049371 [Ensete ventricosum]|nr:hypothetical protein BHE74_00049371 [Ensete ventricosum]